MLATEGPDTGRAPLDPCKEARRNGPTAGEGLRAIHLAEPEKDRDALYHETGPQHDVSRQPFILIHELEPEIQRKEFAYGGRDEGKNVLFEVEGFHGSVGAFDG